MKERKWLYYGILLIIAVVSGGLYTLFSNPTNDSDLEGQAEINDGTMDLTIDAARTKDKKKKIIYVDISGAVVHPGVYEMQEGARVFEVIELAGGLTEDADCSYINQAKIVSDEDDIRIPTKDEVVVDEVQNSSKVNINTAGQAELMTLAGIGKTKAKQIMAHRNENGAFQCIEDIMKVDGIKEGLFNKIKEDISVK